MKILLVLSVLMVGSVNWAAVLNKVDMPEVRQEQGKKLVLNGMTLRKVYKFGIPIKVYVGGLYLEKKSDDSKKIIENSEDKLLLMEFVRSVDREKLIDQWKKGISKNCGTECAATKPQLSQFNKLMVNARRGSVFEILFTGAEVKVNIKGHNSKKGVVTGAAFAKQLLALFIGEKSPVTKTFRKELLGKK